MAQRTERHLTGSAAAASEGWVLTRLTPPSRLYGANGIRTGADGRIYVAQVIGSQVSAIDVDSGGVEDYCARGGPIVAPDDLVFDDAGNLYVTEITENKVRMVHPNGTSEVVMGDIPVANPIT
jgi:sugar lactone lactonase YvrE